MKISADIIWRIMIDILILLIQRALFHLSDLSDLSDLLLSPVSDGAVRTGVRGAERRKV